MSMEDMSDEEVCKLVDAITARTLEPPTLDEILTLRREYLDGCRIGGIRVVCERCERAPATTAVRRGYYCQRCATADARGNEMTDEEQLRADVHWLIRQLRKRIAAQLAKRVTNPDTCIGGDHDNCPVTVSALPVVCLCDCTSCKRAWFADGRPIIRNGEIVRESR